MTAIPVRRLPRVDVVRLAVQLFAVLATVVLSLPYAVGWAAAVVASAAQWTAAAVAAGWRDGRAR